MVCLFSQNSVAHGDLGIFVKSMVEGGVAHQVCIVHMHKQTPIYYMYILGFTCLFDAIIERNLKHELGLINTLE